jgi:farnesyl diphosphate synthase
MELKELFEKHLKKKRLKLKSFHPFYEEALNYMLEDGGKRFRPLLLLSVVEAKNPLLIPSALDVALALEYFHTYSLIHDDLPVMDNSSLRRGKETLHKKFDEVSAVLVGDALNTYAFYLISTASLHSDTKVKLIKELSFNGGVDGMVHGQILDIFYEKKSLDLEQLKTLHINKTAKLIAASLKMGAIIVDMPDKLQDFLYEFGIKLGLLFQIQDDLIDELATQIEAGKTTQNDIFKNSFVNLLGVRGSFKEADKLAKEILKMSEAFDEELKESLDKLLQKFIYRHQELKGYNG